jgi:hypothetical protein
MNHNNDSDVAARPAVVINAPNNGSPVVVINAPTNANAPNVTTHNKNNANVDTVAGNHIDELRDQILSKKVMLDINGITKSDHDLSTAHADILSN